MDWKENKIHIPFNGHKTIGREINLSHEEVLEVAAVVSVASWCSTFVAPPWVAIALQAVASVLVATDAVGGDDGVKVVMNILNGWVPFAIPR